MKYELRAMLHTMAATQPGRPINMVDPPRKRKAPAQINSGDLDIRKTLQNRKKCNTTKATAKPAHQVLVPRRIPPKMPGHRIIASCIEMQNPGLNCRVVISSSANSQRVRRGSLRLPRRCCWALSFSQNCLGERTSRFEMRFKSRSS